MSNDNNNDENKPRLWIVVCDVKDPTNTTGVNDLCTVINCLITNGGEKAAMFCGVQKALRDHPTFTDIREPSVLEITKENLQRMLAALDMAEAEYEKGKA